MSINKHEEKFIIERYFFKKFAEKHFGEPICEDSKSEAPDFLIEINGEKTGIEVMQLINKKLATDKFPLVEKYKFEIDIVETSQKIFHLRNNVPLNIRFNFVNEFQMSQRNVSKLANNICEIIEKQIQTSSLTKHFEFSIEEGLPR